MVSLLELAGGAPEPLGWFTAVGFWELEALFVPFDDCVDGVVTVAAVDWLFADGAVVFPPDGDVLFAPEFSEDAFVADGAPWVLLAVAEPGVDVV